MIKTTPTIEIGFYEGLHSRYPEDWDIIKVLADSYMEAKLYAQALALDEKIVLQFPQDPLVHYNHACSLCRMNQLESALASLKKAIDLGYTDWDFLLSDRDLFALRQTQAFLKWAKIFFPGLPVH